MKKRAVVTIEFTGEQTLKIRFDTSSVQVTFDGVAYPAELKCVADIVATVNEWRKQTAGTPGTGGL